MNLLDFLKRSFGLIIAVGYISNLYYLSEATTFDGFTMLRCVGTIVFPIGGIVGFF